MTPLFIGVAYAQTSQPGNAPVPNTLVPNAPSAPGNASVVAKPVVNVGSYVLGAQDVIRIVVDNYPAYSHDGVPILPDGTINLPFYGQVKVGGKTIPQVQTQLRAILAKRFRKPELLTVGIVSVRPPEIVKPSTVSVLGAVDKPGPVVIEKGSRLIQVLSNIGSIKGRLDEVQVTLLRRGQAPIPLDVATAMALPTSPANVTVQDGDFLTFTATEPGRVVIGGLVLRPDVYELHRTPRFGNELPLQPRLLDVLVAAGGVKAPDSLKGTPSATTLAAPMGVAPDGANLPANGSVNTGPVPDNTGGTPTDLSRFTGSILRQGKTIPLQVGEALTAEDAHDNPANVPILAGDFITIDYVPPKPPKPIQMLTIFVEGSATRQPGAFSVQEGTRVLEVIARAGGLAKPLAETRVNLRRAGNNSLIPIDLQQAFLRDDLQTNPPLKNGDILMVKEPDTVPVSVTGKFMKPDALQLPLGATLSDAIVATGGLTIPVDRARVTIVRRQENGEQQVLRIDTVALLQEHDPSQNVRLRTGDWINATDIPEARKFSVLLSGEVAHGGAFDVAEDEGLTQLLARVGGVTNDALLSDVVVQRGGKTLSVDIYDAIIKAKPLEFPLQDGDFIVVKKNPNHVTLLEAVSRPGPLTMPEKQTMTLLDALNSAGGLQPSANQKAIMLLRRVPEGAPLQPGAVRPEGAPSNIQAFPIALENAVAASKVILQPGDVIYVPSKKSGKSFLGTILPWVSFANLFGL